ncbi:MAG: recombination regulator RecX [Gemmatimonadota bacterium]|nr:recombination regulator RecX [Gemmatimonadota bacterium]
MSSGGGQSDRLPAITSLDPDPRRPGAVRVEIAGARFAAIPREVVALEELAVGRVVDAELQQRLGAAADAEAAFRTVLRALERRSYARADLARRLTRKGHPRSAVEFAVERAAGSGLLDDAAFASNYVQSRAPRGRGPSRLTHDLLSMGVERSLIDRALASQWPEGSDQTALPLALATKRAGQLGELPRSVKRRRILAYLARRGFSGREVTEMVGRVVGEVEGRRSKVKEVEGRRSKV